MRTALPVAGSSAASSASASSRWSARADSMQRDRLGQRPAVAAPDRLGERGDAHFLLATGRVIGRRANRMGCTSSPRTLHQRAQSVSVRVAPRPLPSPCGPCRGTSRGAGRAGRRRRCPAARAGLRRSRRRARRSPRGSRCAPPSGSGTMPSIDPRRSRSCAVSRSASAASLRRSRRCATGSRRSLRARSPNRSRAPASARGWRRRCAMAPPEPPSPMIAATSGTPDRRGRSRSSGRSPRPGRAPRRRRPG